MRIVVDASLLVAALVDAGPVGRWAENVLLENLLVAPELVLIEATNVLRRLERNDAISGFEAASSHRDLLSLDVHLAPVAPFVERVWDLRHNLTSYDASYVALAEAIEIPLATLDRKLARAATGICQFLEPPKA